MPYHNEGEEFVNKTIKSIRDTIDISDYEIIVVDDCSDKVLKLKNARVIRHIRNIGVGRAFDTGVSSCYGDYLFLMGCDVRFEKNNWASNMVNEIKLHPKSLICSSIVSLRLGENKTFYEAQHNPTPFLPDLWHDEMRGARMMFLSDNKVRPEWGTDDKKRSIIDAIWLPHQIFFHKERDFVIHDAFQVPCILGAFYGTTKEWYMHIDGWWGHKVWGTLEAYISLKSHLFGGYCYASPNVITGHLFKYEGNHQSLDKYLINGYYNKLLVSWLLFNNEDREKLINWLSSSGDPKNEELLPLSKSMVQQNMPDILEKREEYRKKIVFPMDKIVEKFKIKF